jgi:RNA polymerase sigma factor (sigma-70 family)
MHPAADDYELLRQYVERGNEQAFASLVARHTDMVYSAAVRQVGRGGMADEVTQAVFILLLRKADRLPPGTVIGAWLFKATRYTSMNALRAQARRRRHEQEAANMAQSRQTPDVGWAKIAPLLDEAIARLNATDRTAVVLRYLERRSLADVGAALGVSENAAHMRVQRATEKMRQFFQRRGMAMSASVLGMAILASARHAAPAKVAESVSVAALYGVHMNAAHAATVLAKSAYRDMIVERVKGVVALTTAVAIVAGGAMLSWPKPGPTVVDPQHHSAPSEDLPPRRIG